MRIVTGNTVYEKVLAASVVTIGNFDGVHRGHAEIFTHLKRKSSEYGIPSAVVTFEPHPLKILAPESAPALITTFDQKTALIEDYGVDFLVVVPFSMGFSKVSANEFVQNVLCTPLGMRHIIIGHDYAFGRNREGNFSTLESLGGRFGFTLEDLPPIGTEGVVFSSSLVRGALAVGDVETSARILGRYYSMSGTVVRGREIGQTLGFPTANILPHNELIPLDGVYAVMVEVNGQLVKGACNIGSNPTVGGKERSIEVFLLDFSGCLYDHVISINFVQRLRAERKFPDFESLKTAIDQDVTTARFILENSNRTLLKHVGCQDLL
ncbi:MAG: bifunctional riboflavin kinase/FAD synthetase [Desulfuromonadaceae bacterium]|nr:bifunctional riboflavin kinase/FAD synthetase [Desulfuromonadaceae bacterium]MDD5106408.1 bifunctional riboflavin kinase/FAD synthetase [Desulfuromonadaceae bacterium]